MFKFSDADRPEVANIMDSKSQQPTVAAPAQKHNVGIKIPDPGKTSTGVNALEFKVHFQKMAGKILAAKNLNEILVSLIDELAGLFESERVTIYMLDGEKRELVSRFKTGKEISEIRIEVKPNSIAGYAAHKQRTVKIKNAYDENELKAIDPELSHDKAWDKKTGFVTKQVLAIPIFFQKYLMGALQFINKKNNAMFSPIDERAATELARIIGIGLHNHRQSQRKANNKFTLLLQKNFITPKELKIAETEAPKKEETIEAYLMKEYKVSKIDILESLGKYHNAPYVEYDVNIPIRKDLVETVKRPFLEKNMWIPLREEGDKIIVAIDDPQNFQKIGAIKAVFPSRPLEFHVALKEDILDLIRLFIEGKPKDPTEFNMDELKEELQAGIEETTEESEDENLVDEKSGVVVKLVNQIIMESYKRNVSDIHIEPQPGKENVRVRIRIDGACREYETPIPYTFRNAIVSRVKIMAGLDIAERRKPQDGKIPFKKYGRLDIELRVATIPTQGAMEDIVMRILAAGEPIPLDKMGFSERNYKEFINIISQPYGIIFVCGPTGSGKTTTLHSALREINVVETKIWTAEDPVEITQKGLRQVQVNSKIGFDFAAAMRAFLRADPDVIMVGEMRDKETTHIGIEASLTGHLVFSTLHTNSAPESVTRLLDMGMDPFNFADAVLGILAQRLVRTLCKDCKETYHPSKEEYDDLIRQYGQQDFERNQPKGLNDKQIEYSSDLMLYKPRKGGCEKCGGTGYRGRMGIHELLLGTTEQKKLIQTQARVEEMRNQAIRDGMRTLKQDGIEKVLRGYTDMIQVKKVCIN